MSRIQRRLSGASTSRFQTPRLLPASGRMRKSGDPISGRDGVRRELVLDVAAGAAECSSIHSDGELS